MKKITYSITGLAMIIFLLKPSYKIEASTSIIVGKKASKDGAVLLGHNQDCIGRCIVNTWYIPRQDHEKESTVQLTSGKEIPQHQKTWAYIWFQFHGEKFSDFANNIFGITYYPGYFCIKNIPHGPDDQIRFLIQLTRGIFSLYSFFNSLPQPRQISQVVLYVLF